MITRIGLSGHDRSAWTTAIPGTRIRIYRKIPASAILSIAFCLFATPLFASSITVTERPDEGSSTGGFIVEVNVGVGGQDVKLVGQASTSSGGPPTAQTEKSQANGTATFRKPRGVISIEFKGEHWSNISLPDANNRQILSDEQHNARNKGTQRKRFEGLPFDSSSSIFEDGGADFAQFQLINLSTEDSFDFTRLTIYTGLAVNFFTSGDFDSPEAIASGHLFADLMPAPLDVKLLNVGNAFGFDPSLTLPIGSGDYVNAYALLTGTARAILSDTEFGNEIAFSVAVRTVPQPSTLTLTGLGLLVAALGRVWRWQQAGKGRSHRRASTDGGGLPPVAAPPE
jgi:hypothetical protein